VMDPTSLSWRNNQFVVPVPFSFRLYRG